MTSDYKYMQDPFFGRIAKRNPVYGMVLSICLSARLRQQFGLALALSSLQNDHWQYLF